ncbi:hypothetical protein [uncultured Amaricoccus sp.]|nr:hypothetical protein [uncultured Amaricoccus sp.]HRO27393.1 hypothetical protein [Luteimonas sp.]
MIELLDTPAGQRDRQVERLLAELRMIEADLLALSDGDAVSTPRAA